MVLCGHSMDWAPGTLLDPTESIPWWPNTLSCEHPSSSLEMRRGIAGQWFTPSIPNSQGGDESPPSPPSEHPGAEGCGLHSCCEQKSNPSSEIQGAGSAQQPNLFCVIRDTDTAASQWEADPAPDELGEYRLLITGGWDALRIQQNAYFFIQQPITSHNVMLHYLQFL